MKGATRGDWNTVRSSFGKRQRANAKGVAANEAGAADEGEADAGAGLFDAGGAGAGSVAAE